MVCRNCKKEVSGKFCSHCGEPLIKNNAIQDAIADFEQERQMEEKSKKGQKETFQSKPRKSSQKTDYSRKMKKSNEKTDYSRKMKKKKKRKKKRKALPSVSMNMPVKAVKKTISRVLQGISALLMIGIGSLLTIEIFEYSKVLGSLRSMVVERNYPLACFSMLMACMIGFSILSTFWILSKRKIQKEERIKSFDSGRGLIPFLCYGVAVLVSPELLKIFPTSYEVLKGVELILTVLYDHTKTLGFFIVIGSVACLIRKFMRI